MLGPAAVGDPETQAGRANDTARSQPESATFLNAIQKFAWADGALLQICTARGQVIDVALREGEGAVAWQRVHLFVKATRSDIMTNLGASL